jgi:hypothetical protein
METDSSGTRRHSDVVFERRLRGKGTPVLELHVRFRLPSTIRSIAKRPCTTARWMPSRSAGLGAVVFSACTRRIRTLSH